MDFAGRINACLPQGVPARIGVAVSGGGDSTALLLMLADWAGAAGHRIVVATVDHGLRPEAAGEAAQVAALCGDLGIAHDTLHWTGWDGRGNTQDQARQARHRLLATWAKDRGVRVVALGHTRDDQAETVLMRLLRGSGLDGLAAMAPASQRGGINWIRPLLGISRAELRDYLRAADRVWIDDPSNLDPTYLRIRLRAAMQALELGSDGLAATAARLRTTRDYLETRTEQAAHALVTISGAGDVVLDRHGFWALHPEIRQRLLAHSLIWVASTPYRPRFDSLRGLLENLQRGAKATLAGCIADATGADQITITREFSMVCRQICPPDQIWDGRWRLGGGAWHPDLEVRALGETGLETCPGWRETGLSRTALLATPALWIKSDCIAAPLAARPQGWSCRLLKGEKHYFTSILSH